MTRKSSTAWDTKPHKPIFYGPIARIADRWAGRRDGKAGIPPLPAEPVEPTDPQIGITPYLEIRKRHFLDRAERERRHMLSDLDQTYRQRAELHQKIVGTDDRAADLLKNLEALPEDPPTEVVEDRNVLEQNAHPALVSARRRREYDARRQAVLDEHQNAVANARALRVTEAQLDETVAVRERILAGRVRQLHEHTQRRCGTYRRALVHKHPDGVAVMPFLDLALPALPGWLHAPSATLPAAA